MDKIRKAGALIISDKKMMIVRPTGKPFFLNPGGKYEEGETGEACLRRELKEELMVGLKSHKFYNKYHMEIAAHTNKPLELDMFFVEIEGEPKPSSEIGHIEWMSREDFEKKKFNTAPSFEMFVNDLIKDGFM